jgi:hypothetical protein
VKRGLEFPAAIPSVLSVSGGRDGARDGGGPGNRRAVVNRLDGGGPCGCSDGGASPVASSFRRW